EKNYFDIAEALIRAGASLDEQDRDGNTALILAINKNSYLAELLLENFANPLIRNNAGKNAYDICFYKNGILKHYMIFYLSFISKNEEEFNEGLRNLNFDREDLNISITYFLGKCDHYRLKYLMKFFI
ncbi:MAG: ankyrin repeat domain-containing protein, partial [Thermoanaerobaculia bacterium]